MIRFEVPEERLAATHPARVLWSVIGTLDVSKFLRGARAVEGRAGRPTLSPQMMLTLWTYAISQGVGSAREIARLVTSDDAYRWIAHEVSVSHHSLSAFRVGHREALDELMSDILGTLMHTGVLDLSLVALDGMRVRASATAPSFRRIDSLLECREQAALHLKAVLAQGDDPEITRAQHAAREAAARDFQRRVEEAISTVEALQNERGPKDAPARASTTDAEARVMKMADGGFRPAYNLRAATAGSEMGGPRTVVGVQVTNLGSDMDAVVPMLDEIERRTGALPTTLLADANHANHDAIRAADERGVEVLIAVPKRSQRPGPNADREPAIVAWRERMRDPAKLRIYRARASLCELTNAHLRSRRAIQQFLVRGLNRVLCIGLLGAITTNLLNHAATLLA